MFKKNLCFVQTSYMVFQSSSNWNAGHDISDTKELTDEKNALIIAMKLGTANIAIISANTTVLFISEFWSERYYLCITRSANKTCAPSCAYTFTLKANSFTPVEKLQHMSQLLKLYNIYIVIVTAPRGLYSTITRACWYYVRHTSSFVKNLNANRIL